MQSVMQYYNINAVDRSRVSTSQDATHFVVELGGGQRETPHDPAMRSLCLRMYSTVCPPSPVDIFLNANADHFETDICGREFGGCPRSVVCSPVKKGSETDFRLTIARICHVGLSVVQSFVDCAEAESFGFERTSFSFNTLERALLAMAIEDMCTLATADDVLRCISNSFDNPLTRHGIVVEAPMQQTMILEAQHLDVDMVSIATSAWRALVAMSNVVSGIGCIGTACHIWVFYKAAHMHSAVDITFVEHHWRVSDTNPQELRHRIHHDCSLEFKPAALSGGVVHLLYPALHKDWPWWVGSDIKRLPPELLPCEGRPDCGIILILPNTLPVLHMRFEHADKRTRAILEKWKKSALYDRVCLTHDIPFSIDSNISWTSSNNCPVCVTRCSSLTEWEEVEAIFCVEFGFAYARDAVERANAAGEFCACCLVHDSDTMVTVGAFSIFQYGCTSQSGESLAVLIDTIVVASKMQAKGFGNVLFNQVIRSYAHSTSLDGTYFVFAQCVRKGSAFRFWFDKLDDSSAARSMLVQAYSMHPERIPVQPESQCMPRARMFTE